MKWTDLNRTHTNALQELIQQQPHEVLRISESATRAEIKVAYIKLVKSYHPDRADNFMSQHNQEVMKLVNAAYKAMMDQAND